MTEPPPQPVKSTWGRWWVRLPLWMAHIGILVAAILLTPEGYHQRLGASTGAVFIFGTVFLWILLFFAKTRRLVAIFCGVALLQASYFALFIIQFNREDVVLKQIMSEAVARQRETDAQLSSFDLKRIFAMLAPGAEFHEEELPGLLERVKRASLKVRELQASGEEWVKNSERRVAAVSVQAATGFRKGIEDARAKDGEVSGLTLQYLGETEKLVSLLIARRGQFHVSKTGPVFNRGQDADQYNEILHRIQGIEEKLEAFRERQLQLIKTMSAPSK